MSTGHGRRPRRRRIDRLPTDRAFDDLVPDELRHLSDVHWTPINVAIRVAKLVSLHPWQRLLDVGAGIGKLCVVGALSSAGSWYGIEHHESLVSNAERLAREFGVGQRTTFLHGDAFAIDWDTFDVLYFYNPFELPLFSDRLDPTSLDVFRMQVAGVEARLNALHAGARVVTLNGFGGAMPASFELLHQEKDTSTGMDLAYWVQRESTRRSTTS